MTVDTAVALLMHYYPAYDLNKVMDLSFRQINIFISKVSIITEMFMGSPKDSKELTDNDRETAKALGCKDLNGLE